MIQQETLVSLSEPVAITEVLASTGLEFEVEDDSRFMVDLFGVVHADFAIDDPTVGGDVIGAQIDLTWDLPSGAVLFPQPPIQMALENATISGACSPSFVCPDSATSDAPFSARAFVTCPNGGLVTLQSQLTMTSSDDTDITAVVTSNALLRVVRLA